MADKDINEEIRLRGHHLICLHFFRGEGYDEKFIASLSELMKRVESGQIIEVCDGADDVCMKCLYLKADKCLYDEDSEEEIKMMDAVALDLLHLELVAKINWQEIKEKLPFIFKAWHDYYCIDCTWKDVCFKKNIEAETLS